MQSICGVDAYCKTDLSFFLRSVEDDFIVDRIKNIFSTSFLNSRYLKNKDSGRVLAGGLVLFVDRG